jgi:hypothetical protein
MTMNTLISFLGKGQADRQTGYRTATYRFDAGFSRSVAFFGMALTEYLKPDRLILVGTAGSMWDVFFEREGADDDAMLQLMAAVEAGQVDDALLELPRRELAQQLGMPVDCLLIPTPAMPANRPRSCSDWPASSSPARTSSSTSRTASATCRCWRWWRRAIWPASSASRSRNSITAHSK